MSIRFRVLEAFDGVPPQNDETKSVVPYEEYEKLEQQVAALTAELEATRELAFQDGYKSASNEARNLVEQYYQRLADNMATKVSTLEKTLEHSVCQVSQHYGQMVYAITSQLLPRYMLPHMEEEFVEKVAEVLSHDDDREIIVKANQPMILRLQSMEKLPKERVEWRMDQAVHDGEIEATWGRGGYSACLPTLLTAVDEILTSCLDIDQRKLPVSGFKKPNLEEVASPEPVI